MSNFLLLPTAPLPFFESIYTLEGKDFVFNFTYNQREDRYYVDVATEFGEVIAQGLKVTAGVDIFQVVGGGNAPKGKLLIVYGSQLKDPAIEELGLDKDLTLLYVEPT